MGVDLRENFIKIARERKNFYEEKFKKSLNLVFENKNVNDLDYKNFFDIIWCMETISHIFPTEKFLEKTFSMLKNGGKLIISDSNGLNPINHFELIRKCGLARKKVNILETKDTEWNEKIWNPYQLIKKLKKIGFLLEKMIFSIFFPRFFYHKENILRLYKFEKIINKIPGIRNLGVVYTIILRKP